MTDPRNAIKATSTHNKHIVMWTIPRSRSTVITRAFEQLPDCIIYDEPLSAVYWQANRHSHYEQDVLKRLLSSYSDAEFNFDAIITELTGELPPGRLFSFQKHMSHHCLGMPNQDWLKQVDLKDHFFIIRHPKAVIPSVLNGKPENPPNLETLGYEHHYTLFKKIQDLLGDVPLVIDTDKLVVEPEKYIQFLCERFEIEFSEQMLTWELNPKTTRLRWKPGTMWSNYYTNVLSSTGFVSNSPDQELPEEFMPVMEECLPFYKAMRHHAVDL